MTQGSSAAEGEAGRLGLPTASDVEGSEVVIGGVLIEDHGGTVRACDVILESLPPQCGYGVIVHGVDWSKVPGGAGVDFGVRWSSCWVRIRVRSHDGAWTFVELDGAYDELHHMHVLPPWIMYPQWSASSPRWEEPGLAKYLRTVRHEYRRLTDESRRRYLERWPTPADWTDVWAEITRP